MKNETKETTFDDLMSEFDIEIPGVNPIPIDEPPKTAAEPKTSEIKPKGKEGEEELDVNLDVDGTDDDNTDSTDLKSDTTEETIITAPKGKSDSFYKTLAAKYIENGTWGSDLALVDEEGKEVPIEDIEDLNEETFFQIQKSIEESKKEELEKNYISIDKLDERKKNLVSIITSGGDLKDIFANEKQAEAYLNPFGNLDLDNPAVQERVYLNSLMQYNKLDQSSAMEVVKAAKKDLTLDTKVKGFVEDYTNKFDIYVENKKKELIQVKEEEKKALLDFKKSISEEYKNYELKPSLVRRLTDSVVQETEEGFAIDSIYEQKMKDPKEAAELILFLNDKEAYLENKLKTAKVNEHIKTRKLVKMIPSKSKPTTEKNITVDGVDNEFDFTVALK